MLTCEPCSESDNRRLVWMEVEDLDPVKIRRVDKGDARPERVRLNDDIPVVLKALVKLVIRSVQKFGRTVNIVIVDAIDKIVVHGELVVHKAYFHAESNRHTGLCGIFFCVVITL